MCEKAKKKASKVTFVKNLFYTQIYLQMISCVIVMNKQLSNR